MLPAGAATAAAGVWEPSGLGEDLLVMLFPYLAGLRVHRVEDTGAAVVISASCRSGAARCPRCGTESSRVHGGYSRVVADGAVGGRPVLIALRVRRFRCWQLSCPQVTFAEQAEGLTFRYRRRSVPLLALLAGFGLELAGRAAARLAALLGITVHPSTVLRLVAALPAPQITAAPEVLGVDLLRAAQGAGVRDRAGGHRHRRRGGPAAGPGGGHHGGMAEGTSRREGNLPGPGWRLCRRRP